MEEIQIKPWEYSCLYFCPHFFQAYHGRRKINNVNARYADQEAIFICKECLEILKVYKRSTSPLFFGFIKRMLAQYFVSIKECSRVMIVYYSET